MKWVLALMACVPLMAQAPSAPPAIRFYHPGATQVARLTSENVLLVILDRIDRIVITDAADPDTLVCWKGSCRRLQEVWPPPPTLSLTQIVPVSK